MNANIIITHFCNLRCKHCYMVEQLGTDDTETIKKNIELLKNILPTIEIEKINFTGGECTTSEQLENLLQWSKTHGYGVSIFTNGLELNDDIAIMCDCLYLSIDGDRDTHNGIRGTKNAFDGVLNALSIAKKHSIPIHVQTTINKFNIRNLTNLIPIYDGVKDHLRSITLECVVNKGNANKNDIILNQDNLITVQTFKQELLEHFYYSIAVRDNIYTKKQIEQFVINSKTAFPFWIDLVDGICYILSPAFSFPITELSESIIDKQQQRVKDYLIDAVRHLKNDSLVILDDF